MNRAEHYLEAEKLARKAVQVVADDHDRRHRPDAPRVTVLDHHPLRVADFYLRAARFHIEAAKVDREVEQAALALAESRRRQDKPAAVAEVAGELAARPPTPLRVKPGPHLTPVRDQQERRTR